MNSGGVWSSSSFARNKRIMFFKNSITWSIVTFGKTPVHILNCYLAPYFNDETNKSLNVLRYILRDRIFRKAWNSRVILAGDFN